MDAVQWAQELEGSRLLQAKVCEGFKIFGRGVGAPCQVLYHIWGRWRQATLQGLFGAITPCLQGRWQWTGASLPAEELALPQRSQQREVDEYASDALEDPELERSQPRPDVSERWAGDGEPGEAEDVSEDWANREGEGSTDFEAEATAGEDFAAEAMDEEGRPGGDLGSEVRNDLAGEAMEEERFGDSADFSADQQKDPQGLTSGGASGLRFALVFRPLDCCAAASVLSVVTCLMSL